MSADDDGNGQLPLGDTPISTETAKLARSRAADGRGVGPKSHLKHDLFRRILGKLMQMHFHSSKGRGLLVDMHAHDGGGVAKDQGDFFDENISWSSARRLIHWKKLADAEGAVHMEVPPKS